MEVNQINFEKNKNRIFVPSGQILSSRVVSKGASVLVKRANIYFLF